MESWIPDLSYSEILLTGILVFLVLVGRFLERSIDEITIILMEIRDNVEPEKPLEEEPPI